MFVYYTVLTGLSLLGAGLCLKNRSRRKDGIFILVAFVVLAGMSAVRYDVGTDYSYIYGPIYGEFLNSPGSVLRWEPGFALLCETIAAVTRNYHALFVVTSVINVGLVLFFYWRYSPNVFVSVFLYVTLSQYYCSMNFIRQMLAAAIALYALPFLKKRSASGAAAYFLIIFLAASFHKSAFIMIPFYFISMIPVNRYTLAVYGAVTAGIYFNTHIIIDYVTRYWYAQYRDNIHMTTPFEIPFTVIRAGILLATFLGSKKLESSDRRNRIFLTYALFDFFFVLMGSRHSIIDRMSMYFRLSAPVAIAIIVHQSAMSLNDKRERVDARRKAGGNGLAVFAALLAVIYGGSLAAHQYALDMDCHGVVPYQTIFSQPFYKGYVKSLKGVPAEETLLEEPTDEQPPGAPASELISEAQPGSEALGENRKVPEIGESIAPTRRPAEGSPSEMSFEDFLASCS